LVALRNSLFLTDASAHRKAIISSTLMLSDPPSHEHSLPLFNEA
jgi:hypothetical protein